MTPVRARVKGLAASVLAAGVAGALAVALAGCVASTDPIRDAWEDREPYPSCGVVDLSQGETMSETAGQPGSSEISCLRASLAAGAGAELTVTSPTVEGDLIREHYRLSPAGVLELYVDSSEDSFSDQRWTRSDCTTPAWLPEIVCP